MNKLKLFFLSIFLGFSGILLYNAQNIEKSYENTMIQNDTPITLKQTVDPGEENSDPTTILVDEVLNITIFDGGKPLVAGGKSVKIEIQYSKPEANAGIHFLIEPNVVVIDNLLYNNGLATGEIRAASSTDKCVITAWGANGNQVQSNIIKIKPYETISDIVNNVMSSSTVIIFIVSLAVTIVARTSIKIFRFGVNYKSNFATVEQQQNFENSMRNEMRNTKSEIQDNLLKICLREINRETKPVKELQKVAEDMKSDRQILEVKLDAIDEKYNEIKHMTESYNRLEAKVNRMQYGENTQDVRRIGK